MSEATPNVPDAPAPEDAEVPEVTDAEANADADVTDDEATDGTEAEATELAPVEEQDWYDDAFGILFAKYQKFATDVNTEVDWLKAHSSDLLTVIEGIEADESDERIASANKQLETLKNQVLKLEEARRSYARKRAQELIAERDDADAIAEHEAAHAKAKTRLRDYTKVFKSNYEGADITPYLPEVKNLGRKGGGGGTGGKRLRGFKLWTVDGKNVGKTIDGKFVSTASDAAREAKIDVSELHAAYQSEAGTTDSAQYPHYLEFTFKDHKFSATREDKDEAPKPGEGADVSPSSTESTNGTATS